MGTRTAALALALTALLHVPAVARDGPYAITRWTVDGGGVSFAQSGTIMLGGTMGQPDAGRVRNGYTVLTGGFWLAGGPPVTDVPDLPPPPVVLRDEILPTTPNPFVRQTRIAFGLSAPGDADIRVFDLRGRLVRTLVSGPVAAGEHSLLWTAEDESGLPLSAGVYFLRVRIPARSAVQKLVILR